jgi:HEAT repeat protein
MVTDGAPQLIDLLSDPALDVRRAAVVAFGQLTQHG